MKRSSVLLALVPFLVSCGEEDIPIVIDAEFSSDKTEIGAGESVAFTDESTGGPTGWQWTFEDGTPASSTEQNPTVVYAEAGTFSVTLKITKEEVEDEVVKQDYITVSSTAECQLQSFSWVDEEEGVVFEYDQEGRIVEVYSEEGNTSELSYEINYTANGDIESINSFTPLKFEVENNRVVLFTLHENGSSNPATLTYEYEYDVEGRISVSTRTDLTQTGDPTVSTYSYASLSDGTVEVTRSSGITVKIHVGEGSNPWEALGLPAMFMENVLADVPFLPGVERFVNRVEVYVGDAVNSFDDYTYTLEGGRIVSVLNEGGNGDLGYSDEFSFGYQNCN